MKSRRHVGRPVRVAHVTTVDMTQRFLLLAQLRRLRHEGFDVTAISAPGPWVADLEAEGIRHIAWRHATRAWNVRSDVLAFAELLAIFRRERFDIVHTHNPKPGILGRIAARLAGTPFVLNTVHGFYATPDDVLVKRSVVLALEALAASFSDLELFQSEEDLRWARRRRVVRRDKSELLGNGVDLSRFDPAVAPSGAAELRRELGLPDDTPVVGAVGRLVAEKGYRELFAAARAVRADMPDVRFVVLGDPDLEKADAITRDEIEAASHDVAFLGWRTDVRDVMALMDVFVLPSWREGVPRSAIEAAALGKGLVLTDIRGCREVARDGIEGLLIPPRRPDALAAAITRLLRDAGLRERLGRAARARMVERFDERRVVETIVARYHEFLGRRPVSAPSKAKRGLDLVASGAALFALSPLLAVIGAIIRASGRPVLFVQERPGLEGRIFRLYKFRTMRDARDERGRLLPDGERLTRFGRLLRATSLDELPELFNVLKGDMSLVGPRPLRVEYLDLYTPEQARRHEVRPGITGWAQVNGRNSLSWEERFALDVWYADNRSFWLDLKILLKTVPAFLAARGINQDGHATMPAFTGTRPTEEKRTA
jgi:lipopolysaccharide/colanic/teichoic acid biosynthesis glycosyltransferase